MVAEDDLTSHLPSFFSLKHQQTTKQSLIQIIVHKNKDVIYWEM